MEILEVQVPVHCPGPEYRHCPLFWEGFAAFRHQQLRFLGGAKDGYLAAGCVELELDIICR